MSGSFKKFFTKIFNVFADDYEEKNPMEDPEFIDIEDVQKFCEELIEDFKNRKYHGLTKEQKQILLNMLYQLKQYSKQLRKLKTGEIKAAVLKEIAREIFIISCASTKAIKDCLKFHQKCGFGVEELNNFSKKNPDINPLAAMLAGGRGTKELNILIKRGANVNEVSACGNNLAHFAASIGVSQKMMGFLIDKGVDINAKNNFGMTAFDIADLKGNSKMADFLQKKGGISGLDEEERQKKYSNKSTALNDMLFDAVAKGQTLQASLLIGCGADVNNCSRNGENVLQMAAKGSNDMMVMTLAYHSTVATKERAIGSASEEMREIIDSVGPQQTRIYDPSHGDRDTGHYWIDKITDHVKGINKDLLSQQQNVQTQQQVSPINLPGMGHNWVQEAKEQEAKKRLHQNEHEM